MKKQTLSASQRRELLSIQRNVQRALAAVDRAKAGHAKLEKNQGRLEREIERLENSGSVDTSTARELATAREQLKLLTRRLESETEPAAKELDQLVEATEPFNDHWRDAITIARDQLRAKILAAIRPFYNSDQLHDEHPAVTGCCAHQACVYIARDYLDSMPITKAKATLAAIDALLKGRPVWVFKPQ
jgi:hypothetical protein